MNSNAPFASTSVSSVDSARPSAARFTSSMSDAYDSVTPRLMSDTATTPIVVVAISSVAECLAISSRIARWISAGVFAIRKVLELWIGSGSQVAGGALNTSRHRHNTASATLGPGDVVSGAHALRGDSPGMEYAEYYVPPFPMPPAPKLSIRQRIAAALRRFEDSPAGDLFGIAVLFILLVLILFIGGW